MQEPCVAEVEPGKLLMLARTGSGSNHACWSEDGGETWTKPEPTSQTAACSSLTLRILPDGRPIVFYNHTKPLEHGSLFPRTPLCYAVSNDRGQTWEAPVLIDATGADKRDRQNIYPGVAFTKEGMVVVYSRHPASPTGEGGAHRQMADDCGGLVAVIQYPE
jgi:alpha-L-rhamnosidase